MAVLLLAVTLVLLWLSRPEPVPPSQSTPIMNIIRNPTSTPVIQSAATQELDQETSPTDGPGILVLGSTILVSGTGGDGLRIRINPGLNGQIQFIAAEGEAFSIEDGPQDKDGYTWWYIVGVEDGSRRGWAVADFMQPEDSP